MLRSFMPFLLASLGFILFITVLKLPLFEWQISEVVAGSSSACNGGLPSSLTTTVGESLDLRERPYLSERLSFVVSSSQSFRIIEGITRHINRSIIPWLWLLLFLCVIYVWRYAIYHKRTLAQALISSLVAMILLCVVIDAGRLSYAYVGSLGCLQGAFNAELSIIHYETLLVLFTAILAEAGAIVVMLRQ